MEYRYIEPDRDKGHATLLLTSQGVVKGRVMREHGERGQQERLDERSDRLRLNIQGAGLRFYWNRHMVIARVGYTHPVIVFVPYLFQASRGGQHRNNLTIWVSRTQDSKRARSYLRWVVKHVQYLAVPDIYTGRGIAIEGQEQRLKVGKRTSY